MQRPASPRAAAATPKTAASTRRTGSTPVSARRIQQQLLIDEERERAAQRERTLRSVTEGVFESDRMLSDGLAFCEHLANEIADRAAQCIVNNYADSVAVHYTAHSIWDSMLETIGSTLVTRDESVQPRDINPLAPSVTTVTSESSLSWNPNISSTGSRPSSFTSSSSLVSPQTRHRGSAGSRRGPAVDATQPYVSTGAHVHHSFLAMGASGPHMAQRRTSLQSRSTSVSLVPTAADELLRGLDLGNLRPDDSLAAAPAGHGATLATSSAVVGTRSALKGSNPAGAHASQPERRTVGISISGADAGVVSSGRVGFRIESERNSAVPKGGATPQTTAPTLGIGLHTPVDAALTGGDSPSLRSAFRMDPAVSMPDYDVADLPDVVRGKWRSDQPPCRTPCDEYARNTLPLHIKYIPSGSGAFSNAVSPGTTPSNGAQTRRRAQTGFTARSPSAGRGLGGTVISSQDNPLGATVGGAVSISRTAGNANPSSRRDSNTLVGGDASVNKPIANLMTVLGRQNLRQKEEADAAVHAAWPTSHRSSFSTRPPTGGEAGPKGRLSTAGRSPPRSPPPPRVGSSSPRNAPPSAPATGEGGARTGARGGAVAVPSPRPPLAAAPPPPPLSSAPAGDAPNSLPAPRSHRPETARQKAQRLAQEAEARRAEALRLEREEESALPPDADVELHRRLRERLRKERAGRQASDAKREAIETALANPQVSGKPFVIDGSKGVVLSVLTLPTSAAGQPPPRKRGERETEVAPLHHVFSSGASPSLSMDNVTPRRGTSARGAGADTAGDAAGPSHPHPHTSDGIVLKGATPRYIISGDASTSGDTPTSASGAAHDPSGGGGVGRQLAFQSRGGSARASKPSPSPARGAAGDVSIGGGMRGRDATKKGGRDGVSAAESFVVPESMTHMLIEVTPSGGVAHTELTPRPASMQQQMGDASFAGSGAAGSSSGGGGQKGHASSLAASVAASASTTVGIRRQAELVYPQGRMDKEEFARLVGATGGSLPQAAAASVLPQPPSPATLAPRRAPAEVVADRPVSPFSSSTGAAPFTPAPPSAPAAPSGAKSLGAAPLARRLSAFALAAAGDQSGADSTPVRGPQRATHPASARRPSNGSSHAAAAAEASKPGSARGVARSVQFNLTPSVTTLHPVESSNNLMVAAGRYQQKKGGIVGGHPSSTAKPAVASVLSDADDDLSAYLE